MRLTLLWGQRKIVVSSENRTHTFGFLDRRSTQEQVNLLVFTALKEKLFTVHSELVKKLVKEKLLVGFVENERLTASKISH